jgi:hypothetical protein
MLGLALVAALASMAFIGASSASAEGSTALCEVDELVCPPGSVYGAGTPILAELLPKVPSVLLGPGLVKEVECTSSHSSGKITTPGGLSEEGEKLTGNLESLSFGGCTHKSGVGCTVTIVKLGTLLLLKTGPNHGDGLVHNVLVRVVCALVLNCVYKTNNLPFLALGATLPLTTSGVASLAKLHFDHAELEEEEILVGVGCPDQGYFDAEYAVQTPHDVFITL